jgi:hypothetical protein
MNKNVKRDFEELLKYHNVSKLDKIFDSFSGQVNRYLGRIEEIRNNPDLVILAEGIDGIKWARKDSAEGKKHLRKIENNRIENETHAEMMSNISETVFEDLCDKSSVSKIEIRQGLDKYGKFSIDNLNEVAELLTDEGIEVK